MGKATGAPVETTINEFELVGLVTFGDWLVVGLNDGGGSPREGYAGPSPTA